MSAPETSQPSGGEKTAFDRRIKVAEIVTKAVSALMLVAGGLVGWFKYLDQQDSHRREEATALQERQAREEAQRKQELALRQKELQVRFYEQQMVHYLAICDLAARLANAPYLSAVPEDLHQFLELYWGKVCVFESDKVEAAQRAFYDSLIDIKDLTAPPPARLKELCYALAHACREDLKVGFDNPKIGPLPAERKVTNVSLPWKIESFSLGKMGRVSPYLELGRPSPFIVMPPPSLSAPLLPGPGVTAPEKTKGSPPGKEKSKGSD
jgi:hypothetical protein